MRHEIDKIEIKDPPIEELNKKRSCVKRSCTTGCGCFVFIFLLSIAFLYFSVGPRSKELKDLPTQLTENVPLYDMGNIDSITYTPGKERGRRVEMIAYIPKLFLSPFVIYFDHDYRYIPRSCDECELDKWEKFIAFMTDPVTDQRDIYEIEWRDLTAKQQFITSYYETEFAKHNFNIKNKSSIAGITQFSFEHDTIVGVWYSDDNTETPETDLIKLRISLPQQHN